MNCDFRVSRTGIASPPSTRDPSGVLPTVINDDPVDWDIGGRLESHDGLEVHAWTFDEWILHASFDPDGVGPADTRLFAGVCPYAPTRGATVRIKSLRRRNGFRTRGVGVHRDRRQTGR
jgi:hypothetical protein